MTGTFQGFTLSFGSFGHQYTTIDGERFVTWFDLREPQLKGLVPGCRVEYEARPAPTVIASGTPSWALPAARIMPTGWR